MDMMTLSALVDTPAPSLFLFSIRCPYNGLFVMLNFPKLLLPLLQGLQSLGGWGRWGAAAGNYSLLYLTFKGEKNQTQRKGIGFFFFHFCQKKRYQLKVKEKNFKSGLLSISSFYTRKQRLRRASPRSYKRLKIQD